MTHGIDKKWHDGLYVEIYDLAKQHGYTNSQLAKHIGVCDAVFVNWIKKKPALKLCLDRARDTDSGQQTFQEYAYGRLPPNLKELWDRINGWDGHRDAYDKVQAILNSTTKRNHQHLFIYAMIRYNFCAAKALRSLNLSKRKLNYWLEEPEFKELLKELDWHKGNFFESALMRLVKNGEVSAVLMANRTFNRDRGYNPPKEVNTTLNGTLDHNHTHTGASATLDELPLELRRQILEHLRAKRLGQETIIPDNSSSENGFTPGKLPDKRLKPLDYQSLEDDGTDNRSNSNGEEHSST